MIRSITLIFLICSISTFAQTRIAILPFSNLDGNFDYNKYCYELQDSLTIAFSEVDPDNRHIIVIPASEVDEHLDDLNISADSPTFDVDKWKILEKLECDRVISGTFRIAANRFVINSYIYYPETLILDHDYQAKDIFKREDKILEAVSTIVRQLSKAFIKDADN